MNKKDFDDCINDIRVTNEDYQGFLLALSDMLDDCTTDNTDMACFALKRDRFAIAAILTALNKNAKTQATMLDKLADTNKKDGGLHD